MDTSDTRNTPAGRPPVHLIPSQKGNFLFWRGGGVADFSEKKNSRYGANFAAWLPLGLTGSYGIADRDPKRGDIDFLSIGPLASFAIAISPPFLPRSTTLGARSDPPMLAFHLKRYRTVRGRQLTELSLLTHPRKARLHL
jgi:hypothetical protein